MTKKTVFLKEKGSSDKVKAKVTYNSAKQDDRADAQARP